MKLTPDIIRNLIKEEIESLYEFQPGERRFTDPVTKKQVQIPVETLARGLAAQCKNIDHALDAVVQRAQELINDHQAEAKDDTKASNSFTSGFSTSDSVTGNRPEDAVEEASTRRQQRWACAVKAAKPEVAHMCYDTKLSGKKKKKKK